MSRYTVASNEDEALVDVNYEAPTIKDVRRRHITLIALVAVMCAAAAGGAAQYTAPKLETVLQTMQAEIVALATQFSTLSRKRRVSVFDVCLQSNTSSLETRDTLIEHDGRYYTLDAYESVIFKTEHASWQMPSFDDVYSLTSYRVLTPSVVVTHCTPDASCHPCVAITDIAPNTEIGYNVYVVKTAYNTTILVTGNGIDRRTVMPLTATECIMQDSVGCPLLHIDIAARTGTMSYGATYMQVILHASSTSDCAQ